MTAQTGVEGAHLNCRQPLKTESSSQMGRSLKVLTLIAVAFVAAGAAGVVAAQAGLSYDRTGLGLKPQTAAPVLPADLTFGGEAVQIWQAGRAPDFALYGGTREVSRVGLYSAESYGGIVYSLSRGWGSSFEAGYAPESVLSPRRYALTGQLHASFSEGRALSVGLKYRLYDADIGLRSDAASDTSLSSVYTLAPMRVPGTSVGPSYQLQFSYQYSAAGSFGLALGRDVETYTPSFDPTANAPRQLTFTGQHWLTPTWALSYDVLASDPANPLRLQSLGLRLGVRYRF